VPLAPGHQHFWEIKMNVVYGSAFMVGIATDKYDVTASASDYNPPLGKDAASWGYNYNGKLYHAGAEVKVGEQRWGIGSILGVHLDRLRGTLEYYLNREPLGIVFRGA
jgi:SPRY domain-containing SOCS box protein 3